MAESNSSAEHRYPEKVPINAEQEHLTSMPFLLDVAPNGTVKLPPIDIEQLKSVQGRGDESPRSRRRTRGSPRGARRSISATGIRRSEQAPPPGMGSGVLMAPPGMPAVTEDSHTVEVASMA